MPKNERLFKTNFLNTPKGSGTARNFSRICQRRIIQLGVFGPTFHAKSPKPVLGNFNGFHPDSRRLSAHFDRFSVIFNHFQSVSISLNLFYCSNRKNYLHTYFRARIGNLLPALIVRIIFGNFLPLETAEVDRGDHKEQLPKCKLSKMIVSAAPICN